MYTFTLLHQVNYAAHIKFASGLNTPWRRLLIGEQWGVKAGMVRVWVAGKSV